MVTDIRPLPGDSWLAMCECGLFERVHDKDTAWTWLLEHECPVYDPPHDAMVELIDDVDVASSF